MAQGRIFGEKLRLPVGARRTTLTGTCHSGMSLTARSIARESSRFPSPNDSRHSLKPTDEPENSHKERLIGPKGAFAMDFGQFRFGSLAINGVTYERDVVIDRGKVRKRKKKPSKKFREEFGHTPISVEEKIPWNCERLVIGTGRNGSLPVMDEVRREARRRKIELVIIPTEEAIESFAEKPERTNAILHVTC